MTDKTLFLLDGHALVYRAHYAFINRPLINSKGLNTSAISGFVRTLWDLMVNKNPSHIAVCFDPKGLTFRHEMYKPYKANREETPKDITTAIPIIMEIVKAFNIPILSPPGFEADDVIGTLSKAAEKEGFTVYMVTPDKDYGQLVSKNIFMYKPSRSGNGVDILGVPEILEKWDIERIDQVVDVLGLQGDSVDNIPGVPGVGPKTATKLLKQFGSAEAIFDNTDQLKGKLKENLETYKEQGLLSKTLARINIEVPVEFDAEKFKIEPINKEKVAELFKDLEFRTLAKQVLELEGAPGAQTIAKPTPSATPVQQSLFGGGGSTTPATSSSKLASSYAVADKNIQNVDHDYQLVDTKEKRADLVALLEKQSLYSFDTETTGINPHKAELVGLAFSVKDFEAYYVPVPAAYEEAKAIAQEFKAVLEDPTIEKIGQNMKYDLSIMRWYDVQLGGVIFDTMIAHYLCEPDKRHKLDFLSEDYLNYKMVPISDLIGKGKGQLSMRDIDVDKVSEYAGEDADITFRLKKPMQELLETNGLTELYHTLEEPLIQVLGEMEFNGVRINPDFLNDYSVVLGEKILEKQKEIYKKAGVEFNIASPRQVGQVLFERLEIPYRWKKTSSGQFSTDVEKLAELSVNHEIVQDILNYRKFAKLKSTYVDTLPLLINPKTGRVHSNFNQARAATGRLSSENPNLQNIPIKDEAGREIRKAFEPRDSDHILLAADYSQIELRLIADISKDESMMEAFLKGQDFHKATAAKVYNVPFDEVTADQRRNAKTVNFSITYGAGATNLSRQLGIKRTEATELIEQYFKQFPGLRNYMNQTIEFAKSNGYVETIKGRKRYLRDINSNSSLARSNAERMAINTPVQGSAADMIKIAMISLYNEFKTRNLKSKMIMQVHDELVFDVHRSELDLVKTIVEDKMKNAISGLTVPIEVEMGIGENWLEAH